MWADPLGLSRALPVVDGRSPSNPVSEGPGDLSSEIPADESERQIGPWLALDPKGEPFSKLAVIPERSRQKSQRIRECVNHRSQSHSPYICLREFASRRAGFGEARYS